jgi:hypothetical protein
MSKTYLLAAAVATAAATSYTNAAQIADINGTKISFGGYIKVEGTFNRPDSDAANDAEDSFIGQARQSRFNLKTEREVEGHKVKTFIEGDFFGNSYQASSTSSYFRMRHAYLAVDNLTVGQTWSGQFFNSALFDVKIINFWGLGVGTIAGTGATVRPQLVTHYTTKGFRFTLQDPIYQKASYPDMVVGYTKRTKSGHAFNIAWTGREVEKGYKDSPSSTVETGSAFGAGFSAATKLKLGNGSFHLSGYTGKGMGAYSGIGVGGAYNPNTIGALDSENNHLVEQTGFATGFSQRLTPKLVGNVRYGKVMVDDEAETEIAMTNVNLIYSYFKGLDLGIEWRKQDLDTLNGPAGTAFPNIRPKGKQVEVMAMYKF